MNELVIKTTLVRFKNLLAQHKSMVNVFIKDASIYDLTNYPFTKALYELYHYDQCCRKELLVFTANSATKGEGVQKIPKEGFSMNEKDLQKEFSIIVTVELLDNCIIDKTTKMSKFIEVILNNGKINLLLQPVLRLVNIIISKLVP
jgi:hypothetical protein